MVPTTYWDAEYHFSAVDYYKNRLVYKAARLRKRLPALLLESLLSDASFCAAFPVKQLFKACCRALLHRWQDVAISIQRENDS